MNIQKAYQGAFSGLQPTNYNQHIRSLQCAFAVSLARLRNRGVVRDGGFVSTYDLNTLKDKKEEVRLK